MPFGRDWEKVTNDIIKKMLCDWKLTATPKMKRELQKFLNDIELRKDGGLYSGFEDWDGAVNFADTEYNGAYYVYLWKHKNGTTFYIGLGTGGRYADMTRRNYAFQKNFSQGDCEVYILVKNCYSEMAETFELGCIRECSCLCDTLANDKLVPLNDSEDFKKFVSLRESGKTENEICVELFLTKGQYKSRENKYQKYEWAKKQCKKYGVFDRMKSVMEISMDCAS